MTPDAAVLHGLRERWDSRSARQPPDDLFAEVPAWATGDPVLSKWMAGWPAVWERSRVVIGHVLMANAVLWEPGYQLAPCNVVWSTDPDVEADWSLYDGLYEWFWRLRRDPDLWVPGITRWSINARDDYYRVGSLKLPHLVTDGRVMFHDTLVVDPRLLPRQHLTSAILPLLVDPHRDPAKRRPGAWVLPHTHWTEDFLRRF